MKISVIIPFRNAEAHLGRCIESCKKATGDFEFILVDDNQSNFEHNRDTELAILTKHEDKRFRTGDIGKKIREAFPEPSRWEHHA